MTGSLLLALAILANTVSFNAIAQSSGAKMCTFKVTYDGSTQSLDADSDPIHGTTLNIGDKFRLDIRAAGSGFFESKTTSASFLASLRITDSGNRTGNITMKVLLDGNVVSQRTELGRVQSSIHVGSDNFDSRAVPPLTVGLLFDQILVDYEFLASTASTNVLDVPDPAHPVHFSSFDNPNLFTFHQGTGGDTGTGLTAESSGCEPLGEAVAEVVTTGLNFPFGVAVDPRPGDGSVYIADRNAHMVWKVGADGLIPIAGTGEAGYNGDGIQATQAQLDSPTGVAVDTAGALFIADSGNHVIRKISTPGVAGALITTVAGEPQIPGLAVNDVPATRAVCNAQPDPALCVPARLFEPRGVAVGDSPGKFFIADTMNQQVRQVDGDGIIRLVAGVAGETGPATDAPVACGATDPECVPARLNSPLGVAIDVSNTITTGTVYIADEGNNVIRKVVGSEVTTVPVAGLDSPSGVAVAADGTLYIADVDKHRIQRLSGGDVTTVPGLAGLNSPVAVGVAPNGDLYIADLLNNRILKVTQ